MPRKKQTKTKHHSTQASLNGIVYADVVFLADGVTIADVFFTCNKDSVSAFKRDELAMSVVHRNPRLNFERDFERVYAALWGKRN